MSKVVFEQTGWAFEGEALVADPISGKLLVDVGPIDVPLGALTKDRIRQAVSADLEGSFICADLDVYAILENRRFGQAPVFASMITVKGEHNGQNE